MYNVDNERLISLVRDSPVLWDKSIEHYKCRNSTASAWKEVCEKLFDGYGDLDQHEKESFGRIVIKKWTNLKDCWWRSLKKGADGTKPPVRPYRYYKDMIFLKKNYLQNGMIQLDLDLQESETSGSDNLQQEFVPIPVQVINDRPDMKFMKQDTQHAVENTELSMPTENRHISFFRGILPTLQLLGEDQVLQFQIQVLKILQDIKQSKTQYPSSSSNV